MVQGRHGARREPRHRTVEREFRMTGTRAPRTSPVPSAWLTKASCLASMLPASILGTTRMFACPATPPCKSLVRAAPMSRRCPSPSGPSTSPPLIWRRSAIFDGSAASSGDRIAGLTVSTADSTPTRASMPSACARSIDGVPVGRADNRCLRSFGGDITTALIFLWNGNMIAALVALITADRAFLIKAVIDRRSMPRRDWGVRSAGFDRRCRTFSVPGFV